VKQLNCTDLDIVKSTLRMLSKSSVWKHRCLAAELLITLGRCLAADLLIALGRCLPADLLITIGKTLYTGVWPQNFL
jgi:hypothetical protein